MKFKKSNTLLVNGKPVKIPFAWTICGIIICILLAALCVVGLPLLFYLLYSHYAENGESGKATFWLIALGIYGTFLVGEIIFYPFTRAYKIMSKQHD